MSCKAKHAPSKPPHARLLQQLSRRASCFNRHVLLALLIHLIATQCVQNMPCGFLPPPRAQSEHRMSKDQKLPQPVAKEFRSSSGSTFHEADVLSAGKYCALHVVWYDSHVDDMGVFVWERDKDDVVLYSSRLITQESVEVNMTGFSPGVRKFASFLRSNRHLFLSVVVLDNAKCPYKIGLIGVSIGAAAWLDDDLLAVRASVEGGCAVFVVDTGKGRPFIRSLVVLPDLHDGYFNEFIGFKPDGASVGAVCLSVCEGQDKRLLRMCIIELP